MLSVHIQSPPLAVNDSFDTVDIKGFSNGLEAVIVIDLVPTNFRLSQSQNLKTPYI